MGVRDMFQEEKKVLLFLYLLVISSFLWFWGGERN